MDALKPELEGLRERVAATTASVDNVKKDTGTSVEGLKKELTTMVEGMKKDLTGTSDQMKKDEAQLVILKEGLTAMESVKKEVDGIEVLKEKLAGVTADIKSVRDEAAKLQQSSERSRSNELERKVNQDLQFKQVDESLKELQKGLQDCREKLARLEGAQPGAARTNPPAKP